MKFFGLISLLITIAIAVWWFSNTGEVVLQGGSEVEGDVSTTGVDPIVLAQISIKSNLIKVTSPIPGEVIKSPLTITGQAKGFWFFEGDFPIVLTDWDGKIIAEGFATAKGEWMTEDFVPFSAQLEFLSPYSKGDLGHMRRGTIILQKDNPFDLPVNDDALEIPIRFSI